MGTHADLVVAAGWAAGPGQGWRQISDLLLAFALSSIIGLERHLRGKRAGLRTEALVGTASALFLLVGKYGFSDVVSGHVSFDPSRVAAQVVSGVGFLGAGLIITRMGAVRGLTTAASVWEASAIGMAAGAGLPLLALIVTGLHMVVAYGYTPLAVWLAGGRAVSMRLSVTYVDGRGVLRRLLALATSRGWTLSQVRTDERPAPRPGTTRTGQFPSPGPPLVRVDLGLRGTRRLDGLVGLLSEIDGVVEVTVLDEEDDA